MRRERIGGLWREGEWLLIAALAIAATVLGYLGFARHSAIVGPERTPSDLLYLVAQLFTLGSGDVPGPVPWELQLARVLAPVVGLYAAIKALWTVFGEQLQHTRLWRLRDHAVVCGAGRKGLALARAFRDRGTPVVMIEEVPGPRSLVAARAAGAILLRGDAADPATLSRARLSRARCALIVCGNDSENAEVAVAVKDAVADAREHPLSCAVHITDPELCDLLRKRWSAAWMEPLAQLEFFNVFDRGARALLDEFPPDGAAAGRPHLLVVGMGNFGESLVLQAAWRWRSGNANAESRGPLAITVLDREAEQKCATLCARYDDLPEACAVRPLTVDVTAPEFERAEFMREAGVTCVYVCLDDEARSLAAALVLHRRLDPGVPIVVRTEREAGLATLFGRGPASSAAPDNLHMFGLLDRACTPEYALFGTLDALARALHEHYVGHETAQGSTPAANPSLVSWEQLPEDLRRANRRQAVSLRSVLQDAGFEIEARRNWAATPRAFSAKEVELLGRAEHERWVIERRQARWRFGAGPKNLRRRTSPHLVPWDELPEKTREINRAIIRALPGLLADAGYALRGLGRQDRQG